MGTLEQYPVHARDCTRQTALNFHQPVRAITTGIDLDGDGVVDLDRSRIYFHGLSVGGMYGPVFTAVSPDVAAAVFNSPSGRSMDSHRRNRTAVPLRDRRPSLLNKGTGFDDDYVLRYRPVEIIDAPGALAIQEFFEREEWLMMAGDRFGLCAASVVIDAQ